MEDKAIQRHILSTLQLVDRPMRVSEVVKWLSGIKREEVEEAIARLCHTGKITLDGDWYLVVNENRSRA